MLPILRPEPVHSDYVVPTSPLGASGATSPASADDNDGENGGGNGGLVEDEETRKLALS